MATLLMILIRLAAALGLTGGGVPAQPSSVVHPAAVTPLVRLHQDVDALAAPHAGARIVGLVPGATRYSQSPMTLPVLQTADSPVGRWLRVRLPIRPNGVTGWIPAGAGSSGSTPWEIIVHRGQRRAVVFDHGKERASFRVIVGKPSTPTPAGRFFVVERLHLAPGVTEGPWVLVTSGYSTALRAFDGGVGQVGLHGVTGLGGRLGTAVSHGCVRFSTPAITWVAEHVDPGTPVIITS